MCFGDISATSMEKITHLFISNHDDIGTLKRKGEITASYRHQIKKRLNIWQPSFKCAVKFYDMDDPGEATTEVRDLTVIPRKYLHPTLATHYVPVRTEAYTTLKDIKRHHEETHPFISKEDLENDYRNTAVGIDGVLEANHGSRTLIVVSVMFGGCIYLWKIYNPYKNCAGAKPTAYELLRYVRCK